LPATYSKHLAPTLAQRLQEFLEDGDRREQLLLYQEIALARAQLTQALDLAMALDMARERGDASVTVEMLVAARSNARSLIDLVADLCTRCAAIEKSMSDKVSVQQLGYFVEQITRVVHRRLGDTPEARQIADDLRGRVKLPYDPRAGAESDIIIEVDLTGGSGNGGGGPNDAEGADAS
jgi:hypothetical protein